MGDGPNLKAFGRSSFEAGDLRSQHALVKDKPVRTPLSAIKVWKDDPAAVETQGDELKRRYS